MIFDDDCIIGCELTKPEFEVIMAHYRKRYNGQYIFDFRKDENGDIIWFKVEYAKSLKLIFEARRHDKETYLMPCGNWKARIDIRKKARKILSEIKQNDC